MKAVRQLSPIHRMAPWLRTYRSYQGRECSTRPCHGSGYAHSALEHSQLTYGNAIRMSGMQLLRCWYCAIPELVRPPLLDIGYLYCRPFYSAGSGPCARPRDFENRLLSDVLMMCWEPTRRAGIQLVYTKDIVSIVRLQLYVIF